MTSDEKFALLERQLVETARRVGKAEHAIEAERRSRAVDVKRLDDARDALQAELEARDSRFAVNGIPVAVSGLGLAAVGLVLQAVASLATFPA